MAKAKTKKRDLWDVWRSFERRLDTAVRLTLDHDRIIEAGDVRPVHLRLSEEPSERAVIDAALAMQRFKRALWRQYSDDHLRRD